MEKQGAKLGFFLMLLVSALITFIIISIVSYFTLYIVDTAKEYDGNLQRSISTLLFGAYSHAEKTGDYSEIEDVSNTLSKDGIIAYIYVLDKQTGNVIWSKTGGYSTTNGNNKILEVKQTLAKNTFIFGYVTGSMQTGSIQTALMNSRIFIIAFLIMGFILSVIISSFVSRPINSVVKGTQEFSKGNFDYRLKKTSLQEVNEIVDACNEMAKQLKEFYSSLELKVQERTEALENANKQLKETQAMMVHSEKMRSLGELVAGIAHEINNPINFIYGNIVHLERYSADLINLIELYDKDETILPEDKKKEIEDYKKEIDLDFLKDDIKDLIKSCKEGTERTKNIVLDLKNFSRLEEMVLSEFDVAKELDTTLNILHNKIKNRVIVHKNYGENIPKIPAYGGQLNQVFMNVLDNAQYAVGDSGDIFIDVSRDDKSVIIKIKDSGKGIEPENLKKIFEPFYTTKPVGEGTGLGMSIAYKVIQNHKGKIDVESEVGVGTTFTITLPIENKEVENGKV